MELSDGPQFPRIESILRSKGLLKRDSRIERGSAAVSFEKIEGARGEEEELGHDETHESREISSVGVSAHEVLEVSAQSLIERSRQIPVMVERSIFDGLSTRARALVYHGQEEPILRRLRVPRPMRKTKVRVDEEGKGRAPSWKDLSEAEITRFAIAVYKKPFMNRKWHKEQICKRRGKGKLAEIYRDNYLKRVSLAALIKNMADPLQLDTSEDTSGNDENLRYFTQEQEEEEEQETWETLFDETHQAFYYHNRFTGESLWRDEPVVPQAEKGEGDVES
jgi:hypothetical protein